MFRESSRADHAPFIFGLHRDWAGSKSATAMVSRNKPDFSRTARGTLPYCSFAVRSIHFAATLEKVGEDPFCCVVLEPHYCCMYRTSDRNRMNPLPVCSKFVCGRWSSGAGCPFPRSRGAAVLQEHVREKKKKKGANLAPKNCSRGCSEVHLWEKNKKKKQSKSGATKL